MTAMLPPSPIEDRVSALEKDVAELKKRTELAVNGEWLSRVAGSLKNEPEFDRVLEFGRAAREANRPDGEQEQ
ncbi:MAG TPA: hypothetical protein VK797_00820 [Tepidisphaeraceae bacterium]|jgi:hypothetical protein|nr:hypothetical protein [Tepidisphaeraceae bacterium]